MSAFLLRMELRRRAPDLAVAALMGACLPMWGLNAWEALCVEGVVVTAVAALHVVRGPRRARPALPVAPGLVVSVAAAAAVCLSAGLVAGAVLTGPWWTSRAVLVCWAAGVASGAELAVRTLGPWYGALSATAVAATAVLLAPLIGSPLFPAAADAAMAASPLVTAGLLLGVEVAQAAPLYAWSTIGLVEFRYPPVALNPALALTAALALALWSGRIRSGTCV